MMDVYKIIREYYQEGDELYHMLVKHSEQVRDLSLQILDNHPEYDLDDMFVKEAAMLHDIGIFLTDAPSIYCHGLHDYVEHGYLGAELMRSRGLDRHALVCERHTGVGITKEMIEENKYALPLRDFVPVSMEEKLICYADKFFSKAHLDRRYTLKEAREKIARFGESEGKKFDDLHALFG